MDELIKNKSILADALAVLAEDSGKSEEYCEGLVFGVVTSLTASGLTLQQAFGLVASNMPSQKKKPRIAGPKIWLKDLVLARVAYLNKHSPGR